MHETPQELPRRRGRVLVIRGGAIGDFILTLPVLAALRQHLTRIDLDVLAYPQVAALAQAAGVVDGYRSIDARPLAGFFAQAGTLDPDLTSYFARFDLVVSYLFDPDAIFRANVERCGCAQFVAGPHRPSEQEGVHATEALLKPLEVLALFNADPVPRLRLKSVGVEAAPGPGRWVAAHPGSGSPAKNWPEDRWASLLERMLAEGDERVLLVGGEAEAGRVRRLAGALPQGRVEVALNLPLVRLAERLSGCAAFVGHDSGITHLAAALGLAVVALWGPSSARVWQPRGERIQLVRSPFGLEELSVDEVWNVLRRF